MRSLLDRKKWHFLSSLLLHPQSHQNRLGMSQHPSFTSLPSLFGGSQPWTPPELFSPTSAFSTVTQTAMISQIKFPSVEDFPGVITGNKTHTRRTTYLRGKCLYYKQKWLLNKVTGFLISLKNPILDSLEGLSSKSWKKSHWEQLSQWINVRN